MQNMPTLEGQVEEMDESKIKELTSGKSCSVAILSVFRLFWLVCITKNMLLLCDLSSIWWHLLSHTDTQTDRDMDTQTHTVSLSHRQVLVMYGDGQMDRVDQVILLYCKSSSVQSASRGVFLLHSASPSQSLATSVNITLKCGWKCRAGGFRNYILFDTHSWIIRPDVLQCYPRGMSLWACVVERLIEML